MKKIFLLSLIISTAVKAQTPTLTADFRSLVSSYKLGALKDQTYCYTQNGITYGHQPHKLQRIASVTKLISTYLASETMDLHKKFKTKIYIGKNRLHIEGGKDPYFEEEKFLLLLKALNDLGYHSFQTVSFNRDFLFYDIGLGTYAKITPEKTRARILYYLNGKSPSFVRSQWASIRKFAREEGVELDVNGPKVTARQVIISDVNPLSDENPVVYLHQSKPLHSLLKTMNVQSRNYVAENVYEAGMKLKNLSLLLTEKGIASSDYKIKNGSGLPIITGKLRFDNTATCSSILQIIGLLAKSIRKHNLELSDVVAVNGGKDLGSFRERFENFPELNDSIISKTGTLKHTSSLAGVLMNGSETPFAILNHTSSAASARKFQDRFVARMFDQLGPATPVDYQKISIFPWDESQFLEITQ
jgi:serine-type D-Ala-D-Ala carboxypeptidase/endopeptidase (penicillin-binding protein 4)